jgi:hypothetical protein
MDQITITRPDDWRLMIVGGMLVLAFPLLLLVP